MNATWYSFFVSAMTVVDQSPLARSFSCQLNALPTGASDSFKISFFEHRVRPTRMCDVPRNVVANGIWPLSPDNTDHVFVSKESQNLSLQRSLWTKYNINFTQWSSSYQLADQRSTSQGWYTPLTCRAIFIICMICLQYFVQTPSRSLCHQCKEL